MATRLLGDQRGNVAILVGLALPVLVGGTGAALAFTEATAVRTGLQGAVDSAVLAGAVFDGSQGQKKQAAARIFAGNMSAVERPLDVKTKFSGDDELFEGIATTRVESPLALFIGSRGLEISVHAAARRKSVPVCVLGLNTLDNGAFDLNGAAVFEAENCSVQANSGSSAAMTMEGGPEARAARFGVHGGHKGDGFQPAPVNKSPRIQDPFLTLPFPSADKCADTKKGLVVKESVTLEPGTYCGGISVSGSDVVVKLKPGVYVMSGGSLHLLAKSRVEGDGVMIAFTGDDATLRIWGSSTVKVTAPTSGPYADMAFMQDRTDEGGRGLWASIGGGGAGDGSKLDYEGVAYFPTQNFWVFGDSEVTAKSPSMAVTADKIWVQGSAKLKIITDGADPDAVRQFVSGVALVR